MTYSVCDSVPAEVPGRRERDSCLRLDMPESLLNDEFDLPSF